ncbi:MAG: hypothetical protein OXR64_05245 [Chloroflexota bacterium]|nr:hypothetical protein [Chloroflexota bacterium]
MASQAPVEFETRTEMTAALRESGLERSADRLGYLERLADEDPDEDPIAIASLRHLTSFLIDQRHLGQPDIGVSPDGVALAQWRVMGNGVLAMEFLDSGLIRFAGASGSDSQDGESLRVSGTLPKTKALQAIQSLLS